MILRLVHSKKIIYMICQRNCVKELITVWVLILLLLFLPLLLLLLFFLLLLSLSSSSFSHPPIFFLCPTNTTFVLSASQVFYFVKPHIYDLPCPVSVWVVRYEWLLISDCLRWLSIFVFYLTRMDCFHSLLRKS